MVHFGSGAAADARPRGAGTAARAAGSAVARCDAQRAPGRGRAAALVAVARGEPRPVARGRAGVLRTARRRGLPDRAARVGDPRRAGAGPPATGPAAMRAAAAATAAGPVGFGSAPDRGLRVRGTRPR